MKKKIVYISGADVFDVKDVRAAFDEVRNTLNLDSDTILFGVPVDEESEMTAPQRVEAKSDKVDIPEVIQKVVPQEPIVEESITEDVEEITEEIIPEIDLHNSNESIEDDASDTDSDKKDAPVVPISSVLVPNKEEKTPKTKKKQKVEVVKEDVADTIEVQEDEITDMLNDEVPSESPEKTLEELLESMEPLREDIQPDVQSELPSEINADEEIDATLESLASEFADNQSKISTSKKTAGRGKIGKLKNILPFKKMKRDDTGLMGDLFGWAGIAANDEDFTIPGFFTNAAAKK
ncbi:MAG: hypothetical protein J5742_03235 [Alphaproteobacteria bacterium]|nr:hypothetical protein [Alphaproteobacteria bacterium]